MIESQMLYKYQTTVKTCVDLTLLDILSQHMMQYNTMFRRKKSDIYIEVLELDLSAGIGKFYDLITYCNTVLHYYLHHTSYHTTTLYV